MIRVFVAFKFTRITRSIKILKSSFSQILRISQVNKLEKMSVLAADFCCLNLKNLAKSFFLVSELKKNCRHKQQIFTFKLWQRMTTHLVARMETASFLFLQKIKRYSGQPEPIF